MVIGRRRQPVIGFPVRALYLDAGVTDVATETNDEELLATSARRWADMVATTENPLENINTLKHVVFVMKNGEVVKK